MGIKKIQLEDILRAQSVLSGKIQDTLTEFSRSCSRWLKTDVFLKFENQQTTGSFKVRGALNKLMQLTEQERKRGVIACSAGNHAQGVAYSASLMGCASHIVMPKQAPLVKVRATEGYGAKVILHGEIFDEAFSKAQELAQEKGYTFVHPYNDPWVMAGQGTIGLEILKAVPDLDSIIVPIGGGGLMSGVATAVKAIRPQVRVYGAVPANSPSMYNLFHSKVGSEQKFSSRPTIADGLAVKVPNQDILESYIRPLVDDILTVSEDEIAEAIVVLMERAKAVVEGSGAVGLAAAAHAQGRWDLGEKCCVLLCGGNIDLNMISKIIERGLVQRGRLARIAVIVRDQPGALNRLTGVLAQSQANVIEVHHDRLSANLQISQTRIDFLIETKSQDHLQEIKSNLEGAGAQVVLD